MIRTDTLPGMRTAFILHGNGRVSRDGSADALAAALRDLEGHFWVDIFPPEQDDLDVLDRVFGFHPLAIEDSVEYTQRPKIERYQHGSGAAGSESAEGAAQPARDDNGYFYMVFHGPDVETFRQNLRTKEIDMFVSDRYLISVHDEPMHSVNECHQKAEQDAVEWLGRGIDVLLYEIIRSIADHYDTILDYLEEAIDNLEERALTDPTPLLLSQIGQKKRELLNLRRIVGPQREVIAQLTRGEVPFIRESVRVYFRDVQDHLIRTVEMVELYRDLVMGARDIYLSSISNHLNQIMKTLTIISVIALPMTVVTSFFGMNFDVLPGIHKAWGFWTAMVLMIGLEIFLIWLFKKKKWI
jgi:magnesium transporter